VDFEAEPEAEEDELGEVLKKYWKKLPLKPHVPPGHPPTRPACQYVPLVSRRQMVHTVCGIGKRSFV
jgi:hypothetical protein